MTERIRIFTQFTQGTFLHVEDSLNLSSPKLRLFAGKFQQGRGMSAYLAHFIDLDDARVLFADLAYGREITFQEFKGSTRGGALMSYRLKINTRRDRDSIFVEISSGPGIKTGAGIVEPVGGKYQHSVNVHFTGWQGRKMGYAVLSYLQAFDVARMMRQHDLNATFPTSADAIRDGDEWEKIPT